MKTGGPTRKTYSYSLPTDKKEKKIFFINKEIQTGSGAMSYMTNGLLIYD
jgi:hypothetical protein